MIVSLIASFLGWDVLEALATYNIALCQFIVELYNILHIWW